MTVREAAAILDVSPRQMQRLALEGQVEAVKVCRADHDDFVGPWKINGDSVRKLRRLRQKQGR